MACVACSIIDKKTGRFVIIWTTKKNKREEKIIEKSKVLKNQVACEICVIFFSQLGAAIREKPYVKKRRFCHLREPNEDDRL